MIAVDGSSEIKEVIDLKDGFFALPGGGFKLPAHWREWIGTIESEQIENRTGLLLLAKCASDRPDVLDAENQRLQRRSQWLYWGLLASGRHWVEGAAIQLTGAYAGNEVSVRQKGRMLPVLTLRAMQPSRVQEHDLRRAASLARKLGELLARPGVRRAQRALRTFWAGLGETDLGERIHQFVRVVSDGFAKARGRADFQVRSAAFVGTDANETLRQLYLMRNNAEHFNEPDLGLEPVLPVRESLERAYKRALQAEALARHCVARFVENPDLWQHFANEDKVDALWTHPQEELARLWGAPLDLDAAVAAFRPEGVQDEGV